MVLRELCETLGISSYNTPEVCSPAEAVCLATGRSEDIGGAVDVARGAGVTTGGGAAGLVCIGAVSAGSGVGEPETTGGLELADGPAECPRNNLEPPQTAISTTTTATIAGLRKPRGGSSSNEGARGIALIGISREGVGVRGLGEGVDGEAADGARAATGVAGTAPAGDMEETALAAETTAAGGVGVGFVVPADREVEPAPGDGAAGRGRSEAATGLDVTDTGGAAPAGRVHA